MDGYCLMTNDVEDLSTNGLSFDEIGKLVQDEGFPRMLDLYDKYNVKATLFVLASFAERYPKTVKMAVERGHEIGSHAYTHAQEDAFDLLSLEKQIASLKKSKEILEDISGKEVISFRAPALRVNSYTPQALQMTGFKIDSSIASQRMDMFMSMGSKNKMQWLNAPRTIYETSIHNLARCGNSGIYEVPVSSFILPYIGTLMRISSPLTNLTRWFLYHETKNCTNKAINFLFHPSEGISHDTKFEQIRKRTNNPIQHLFADIIRVRLKQKKLGESAFELFEKELAYWQTKNYKFVTMQDYLKEQPL